MAWALDLSGNGSSETREIETRQRLLLMVLDAAMEGTIILVFRNDHANILYSFQDKPKITIFWHLICDSIAQQKVKHKSHKNCFLFLFFSRPQSEGWPHHGRTFSIYPRPLSF